jgi:hypothetical protein
MSKHVLTIDQIQGTCTGCKINKQTPAPKSKLGFKRYLSLCSSCTKKKYKLPSSGSNPYRKHKKNSCEKCGFVAIHPCQLDVHHKDHNHKNNDKSNLITLCANCHRLEHFG